MERLSSDDHYEALGDVKSIMPSRASTAQIERGITLLNAIANLREGDLEAVLKLDRHTTTVNAGDGTQYHFRHGSVLGEWLENYLRWFLRIGEQKLSGVSYTHVLSRRLGNERFYGPRDFD